MLNNKRVYQTRVTTRLGFDPAATAHLGWHDLSIASADVHPSIQTRAVVGLDDVATIHLVSANTAVVRSCGNTSQRR